MRSFHPVSKGFQIVADPTKLLTLQEWCRHAILRATTIERQTHVQELPLPPALKSKIQTLSLQDFYINPDQIQTSHHRQRAYPAICLFDSKPITLRLIAAGTVTPQTDPAFLASFTCNDEHGIHVYQRIATLRDKIFSHKEAGTNFQEAFIWMVAAQISQDLVDSDPATHITPENIQCIENESVCIKVTPVELDNGQMTIPMEGAPIYDSPEIIMRQSPDSRALSWAIGCILYEMLALEPAFYNRSGNPGGMFQVMMGITQGEQPPPLDCPHQDLVRLIQQCLSKTATERPSLEVITTLASTRLH